MLKLKIDFYYHNNYNNKISLISMYYKIINEQWKHHGYKYVPGLNVLKEKFNDNNH